MAKKRRKTTKKNVIPLNVLERRLRSLNTIVIRRGGSGFKKGSK